MLELMWAFTQSTETISCLLPIWMVKVFAPYSTILLL
jgi:hypothetical protein